MDAACDAQPNGLECASKAVLPGAVEEPAPGDACEMRVVPHIGHTCMDQDANRQRYSSVVSQLGCTSMEQDTDRQRCMAVLPLGHTSPDEGTNLAPRVTHSRPTSKMSQVSQFLKLDRRASAASSRWAGRMSQLSQFSQLPIRLSVLPVGEFADTFLPIPTVSVLKSLGFTLATGLHLSVGLLVYSADEGSGSITLTGVPAAWAGAPALAILFLANALLLTGGRYSHALHMPWVVILALAFAAPHVAVDGERLGVGTIYLGSVLIGFVAGVGAVSHLYPSEAQRVMDRNFGPPIFLTFAASIVLLYVHRFLVKLTRSWMVGLLLPAVSFLIQLLLVGLTRRAYKKYYFKPKWRYIQWTRGVQNSDFDGEPPPSIHGDIDLAFGQTIGQLALFIESMKFVASFSEIVSNPNSLTWIATFGFSFVGECFQRTGLQARLFQKLAATCGTRNCFLRLIAALFRRFGAVDALSLGYLRYQRGVGFVAPIIIGVTSVARAIRLGDAGALLFADVSQMLPWVLVVEIGYEVLEDFVVGFAARYGISQQELSDKPFDSDMSSPDLQPLRDASERELGVSGYLNVFAGGSGLIFMVLWLFLGPRFLSGLCPSFNENVPGLWIQSGLC